MLVFVLFILIIPVFAYEVYNSDNYNYKSDSSNILFILDFSNSMGEYLNHNKKSNLLKDTIYRILTQIPSDTNVGLRVYGHNCNLLAYNACRSSELLVPIGNNKEEINNTLLKLRPRGMTPITYSLKQAEKKDFNTIDGNKHIILLTDGGENCDESPCEYSIELVKKRRDIKIDVIAFGVQNSDDLAQLRCTADVTGGKFLQANTQAELVNSMEELVSADKNVEALLYQRN